MDYTKAKEVYAEVLEIAVEVEKHIQALSITTTAQHEALIELIPGFEKSYSEHLQGEKCRKVKRESDGRIEATLRKIGQVKKS